jgi:circadian clock protein KaiB
MTKSNTPQAFKGIAVFTPGGDLVYCRDYKKKSQWHLNLCGALQEHLGLAESPHFLVPCYTATVDCWQDANAVTHVVAEAYPFVYRYQGLLNALFGLGSLEWKRLMPKPEYRSPSVFETYRSQFPQLWENHDLILDISEQAPSPEQNVNSDKTGEAANTGTVLRLFVSGHSALTEQILTTLQGVLESSRYHPYTLQMVDVSKHPEQAETDQISATPTLIRVSPKPVRRLVGELDNPRAILSLLSEP